jgi:hypothetical protein
MLAQQQQQQCAFALGAAAAAPAATSGLAPGLPIPNLLGPSALDGWLQLDGLQAKDCYPLQAGLCAPQPLPGCGMVQPQQHAGSNGTQAQVMQQLINQQAMQQLLGLLDKSVRGADTHTCGCSSYRQPHCAACVQQGYEMVKSGCEVVCLGPN